MKYSANEFINDLRGNTGSKNYTAYTPIDFEEMIEDILLIASRDRGTFDIKDPKKAKEYSKKVVESAKKEYLKEILPRIEVSIKKSTPIVLEKLLKLWEKLVGGKE
jgi:hypothetical protein